MQLTVPSLPTPPLVEQTSTLVHEILAQSSGMADAALTRGMAAIEALGNFPVNIPDIAVPDLSLPSVDLVAPGDAPMDPGALTATLPALPPDPAPTEIGALDLASLPSDALTPPLLVEIPLPDPLAAVAPLPPTLPEVATPVAPDYVLPAVPDFAALNIPNAPTLDLPRFTDVAPLAPDAIAAEFVWAEVAYASDNLATLNGQLLSLVQGNAATALPPEVEEAIWQKGVDAEVMMTYQAADEALSQVAARGFAIPGGQLVRLVQQAIAVGLDKDAELSRSTMADQAKLEQENFQYAFTQAMTLEGQLINLFNQVQQRALDAASFRVQAAIDLFNARVALFQADVQAFGAKAEVFKSRLQAALATLEIYRAELSAAQIIGELNVQLTEQFSARIAGVNVMAEVYASRVQAASLTVAENRNRTERYRGEIEAYAAQSRANAETVKTYVTQIEAQSAKASLFAASVSGYASRVDAYRALTDAKLSEATLQFQALQQFPVEAYRAKLGGYATQVSSEAARLAATAEVFAARVQAYAASEHVVARQAEAQAEVAQTTTRLYASQAQVALQSGLTKLKLSMTRAETAQAALRAAGQLATQLASAAMSARNVTASMSASTGNAASMSVSNSVSNSASNGRSYTASTSTNYSSTTGTSHSGVASVTNAQTFSDNQTRSDTIDQSNASSTSMSTSNDTQLAARNTRAWTGTSRQSYSKQDIYNHKGD